MEESARRAVDQLTSSRLRRYDFKRRKNPRKPGLDFADAGELLDSRFRMDTLVMRASEFRIESVSGLRPPMVDNLQLLTTD